MIKKPMISKKALISQEYKCQYCKKKFKAFLSLSKHSGKCLLKSRYDIRNHPVTVLALQLWTASFKGTYRKNFDFDAFARHRDYKFFIHFAEFCKLMDAINSESFMAWCIGERIKMKAWANELVYEKFIKNYIIHEDPVEAVIRSMRYINAFKIDDFFKNIEVGRLLNMLEMGRISPWILFLDKDFKYASRRMNEDQRRFYEKIVNQSAWSMVLRKNQVLCEKIKEILKAETL